MKNVIARLRYIGGLFVMPFTEIAHAGADTGRWIVDKTKVVIQKAKDASPVTVVRKDEFNATWQDTEGGTD